VTLGLTLLSTGVSLARGKNSPIIGIDILSLSRFDVGRIISGNLVFSSMPQLFMGVVLIYSLRHFERQLGTRKFGSFVFLTFAFSFLTQCAVVVTASSMGFNFQMTSGPYFFIYSLLAFYHRQIPKLQPSRHAIFGSFRFSEKSWTYVFALQLLCSEGMSSVFTGLSGLLAGYLYMGDILGLQNYRLPKFLESICYPFSFLVGSTPPTNNSTPNPLVRPSPRPEPTERGPRNLGGWGQQPLTGFRHLNQRNIVPPQQPPPESAIESIVSLGFDRQQAINALRMTNNNVEAAANNLFSGRD